MPSLGRVLRTRDVIFMANNRIEPVYLDRQTLREVVAILDVPEPPEETDQEIEMLLQSAQNDWSSLSQPERAARASQAKDGPHALPTPESTPEPTTQQDPELEPESEQDVLQMQRG